MEHHEFPASTDKYYRRYSFFVGSTKDDLETERRQVIDAVLRLGHFPCCMEHWSSASGPTLPAIASQLNLCDAHILILGDKYGSLADGKLSFTEWEYRLSIKDGRPIVAFLMDQDEFDAGLEKQLKDAKGKDKKRIKVEQAKLKQFRGKLRKQVCRFFSKKKGAVTIARDCATSLASEIIGGRLAQKAGGWIRASSEHGKRLMAIEANEFLRDIVDRIYSFNTLTKRLENEIEVKKAMGQGFWDIMIGRIKREGYRHLFFESGSTLAYITHAFEGKLRSSEGERASGSNEWHIATNNAISLLQLLLHTHLDVRPLPAGVPEEHYGAMFNDILLRNPQAPPTRPRKTFKEEEAAIQSTIESFKNEKRLFLMTASGFDMMDGKSAFFGPHVGSHPNMLFKRAILESGQPVVLFLTEKKLEKPFELGSCFPVCDLLKPWAKYCSTTKLALCLSYAVPKSSLRAKKRQEILDKIKQCCPGFNCLDYAHEDLDSCGVVIAANAGFQRIFGKE